MKLRIHQITWNVANTSPLKNELYEKLFLLDNNLDYKFGDYPDFFVISLQEQSYGILDNYWESNFKELFRKLKKVKGVNYIKIQSNSIYVLNQYVFADIKWLTTCKQQEILKFYSYLTGINGKGTIAFKFKMGTQLFTFLTAHLAAHDEGNLDRIAHYRKVITDDRFYDYSRILNSSFSFYAGDLNFRLINLDKIQLINDLIEHGNDVKFFESLLQNDQLKIAQQQRQAFDHFEEGKINFKPTFKYHQDRKDYNPKRTPSWCDRILYRFKDDKSCKLMYYRSVEDYLQSDHQPVLAVFDLEANIKPISQIVSNVRILSKGQTDVDNNLEVWVNRKLKPQDYTFNLFMSRIEMPTTSDTIDTTNADRQGWPWIGLYKEDFDDLDDYLAYLYVENVQCNDELPEEIVMKLANIEKAEEAFEIEKGEEIKEGDKLDVEGATMSDEKRESLSKAAEAKYRADSHFKELKKKLEWSKLEFSEQTFTQPGRYVLIYFNGDKSVEYISEPFEVTAN